VQAKTIRKAFRRNEFLYTLELKTGELVMAYVPNHHDHKLSEWIDICVEVDHVETFASEV
jgi:iron(III) transport system ATP-binding protein